MNINKELLNTKNQYQLQLNFVVAKPFKHLIIDNFLDEDLLNKIILEFPVPNKNEMLNEFGEASLKHTVSDIKMLGPAFKIVDNLVSSQKFKEFMENISGISDLIFDPGYFGGGTHNNLSGQGMDPHVDFNYQEIHPFGKVHRRLNAILYLNEEWHEEWGGI